MVTREPWKCREGGVRKREAGPATAASPAASRGWGNYFVFLMSFNMTGWFA
jgi:hypothetical protein